MGAIDRFKNANTKFSERGEYLTPITKEQTFEENGKQVTKEVYDRPAHYTLKVQRIQWKNARPPKKGEFYIVEGEVTKSDNPKHPVGVKRTWMQAMDNDVGSTSATDFMVAALGYDRRNPDELAKIRKLEKDDRLPALLAETLDDPTDPSCKNAFHDFEVDVEVKEIITKGNQKPFNLHTFTPNAGIRELEKLREGVESGKSITDALTSAAA